MSSFDLTVTAAPPEVFLNDEETIVTVALPVILPIGGQPHLLGVIRSQLDKQGVEALRQKLDEAVGQMKEMSNIQVASNLQDVEKEAAVQEKLKGE